MSLLREIAITGTNEEIIQSKEQSLDVNLVDVRYGMVNCFVSQNTSTSSALTVATVAGTSTSITVASATGFTIGKLVRIEKGKCLYITNIVGNIITLDSPIDKTYPIGATVDEVIINMAVSGTLGAPQSFKLAPPTGKVIYVTSMIIHITHSTAADDSNFGDIAALTNGVVVRGRVGGNYGTLANWKDNKDIKLNAYTLDYTDKAGGGTFSTSADGRLKERTGTVRRLDGDNSDYMEVLIQDDLTGLISFEIKLQGYVEV